jgi:heat shock protein HslJ
MLAAVLVSMPLAGVHAMDVSELKGRWVLETVDGKGVAPEKGEIYFQVTEQAITGYDGCNRFGASLTQPSQARRGQRGCPPDATQLPLDFSSLLSQLDRATVSGDKLSLPLQDGKGQAQFRRSQ